MNPIHMPVLARFNLPSSLGLGSQATIGSNIPFPKRVDRIVRKQVGKPRLTSPSKNPLSLGIILHGPFIRNFVIPNPPLKSEIANVKINEGRSGMSFDTDRHISTYT